MSFLFSKKADSHVLRQKIRLEKSETEGRGSQAGAKPATTCTAGGRTAGTLGNGWWKILRTQHRGKKKDLGK